MGWDDPAFDKYRTPGASPLEGYTDTLSRKVGLDPYYAQLLMQRESGHLDPTGQVSALSSAGAMGPLQVMPGTGADMAKKYGLDFNTPSGQMEAGVRYYKDLLDKYGDPATAAAAYHSGPARVSEIVGRKGDLSAELGPVGRDYYKWFKEQLAQRQPTALPATPPLAPPPEAPRMSMMPPPSPVSDALRGVSDIAEKTFELPGIKQFNQAAGFQKSALERNVLSPLLGYGEDETLGGQIQKGAQAIEKQTPAMLRPLVGLAAGVAGGIVDIATDPLVWEMGLVGSALGPEGTAAGGAVGLLASVLKHAPRLAKGLATGLKISHAGFMTGMASHALTDVPRGLAGVIEDPSRVDPWMKLGGGALSGFMVAHGLTRKTPVQEGRVKFSFEDESGNLVPMDPLSANQLLQNPGIKQVAELTDLSVSSLWQMLKESRDAPDTPLPEMHLVFGSKSRAFSEATPGGGRLGLDIGHLMADAAALGDKATPEQRSVFLANWIFQASKHEINHLLLEGGLDHTLPIEFRREAGELARKAYGETDSILQQPGDIPMMSYEEYSARLQKLAEDHGVQLDTSTEAYNRVAAESDGKIGNGGVAAIMAKILKHPDPVGFIDRFTANPREAWKELNFQNIEGLWGNLVGELGGLSQIFPAAYMEQISQGLTRPPGELLGRMGGTVVPVPKMGTNVPGMGTPPPGAPMLAEGEFGKGGKPGSKKGRRGYFATTESRTSAGIPESVLHGAAVHPEYAGDMPLGAEVVGGIPTRPVERGVSGGDLTPILPTRPETAQKSRTEIEKQRLLNQIAKQRKPMKAAGEFEYQGPEKKIELKGREEIVPLAPVGSERRKSQERLAKEGLGEIIITDKLRGEGQFRIQSRKMRAEGEVGEDEAYIASMEEPPPKPEPDRANELITLAKSYAKERPVQVDSDKQFWIDQEQERRAALAKRGTFSDVPAKYMKAEGEKEEPVYTGARGMPKGVERRERSLTDEPTGREKQILNLTGEGLSAKQISEKLGLSFFTVRNHMVHMRERAEASSMGEMLKFAREKGWVAEGKKAELPEEMGNLRELVSAGLKDEEIAKELGVSRSTVRREILDLKGLLGAKGKRGSLMKAEGEDELKRFGPKMPVGGKYFRAAELQGPTEPERKEITKRNISSDKAPRLIAPGKTSETSTPAERERAPGFAPPPKAKVARGPRVGGIDDALKHAIATLKAQGKDVSRYEAEGEDKVVDLAEYRKERGRRFQEEETAKQDDLVEKGMKIADQMEREGLIQLEDTGKFHLRRDEFAAKLASDNRADVLTAHEDKAQERTKFRQEWLEGKTADYVSAEKKPFELKRRRDFTKAMSDYVQRTAKPTHTRQMEIFKQFYPELPKTEYPRIMSHAKLPIVKDFRTGYEDWRQSFFPEADRVRNQVDNYPPTKADYPDAGAKIIPFKAPPKMEAAGEGKKIPMPPVDFGRILEGAEKIKDEKSNAAKLRATLGKGLADFQEKRRKEIDTRTKELLAEKEELKARAPEVVVPAVKKMLAEAEDLSDAEYEEYHTGEGAPFKKMFVQRVYGSTAPGKTWAKEITQNILDAFDDVRDENPNFKGKAVIGYDTKEGVLTAKDNGVGMSPDFMKFHFLNPGDSGKRGKDRRGNFGIAKTALFGVGDPFKVKTIWQDPATGKKFQTNVTGNGVRWIDESKAFISKPVEVSPETPTGTDIRVKLDKDIAGFGEEGVSVSDIENYMKKTMSSKFLEDEIGLEIDGKEHKIQKGMTWIRYAKDEPGHWDTPSHQNEDRISTPEADYEFRWRPSSYEQSYVAVNLYNRGQLQSEGYENNMKVQLLTPVKGLPADLDVNVKAKVSATDKSYPWEFDRKNLKGDAQKRVSEWLNKKIEQGRKDTASQYKAMEDDSPFIGNSAMKLMTPGLRVPTDKHAHFMSIANDPFTLLLANAYAGGARKLLRAVTGSVADTKIHLGYSHDWYGLNAPGPWYPDNKARIFLNPWLTFLKVFKTPEIQKALAGLSEVPPGLGEVKATDVPSDLYARHSNLFATEMMATAMHEAAHNLNREHGEEFAGHLTQAAARGFIIGSRSWKPLADLLANPELMEKLRAQAEFFETVPRDYSSPFAGAISERVSPGGEAGLRGEETGPGTAKADRSLSRKVMKAGGEDLSEMAKDLRPDIIRSLRARLHSHLKGTAWDDVGLEGLRSARQPLPEKISEVLGKLDQLGATAEEVDRVEGFAKYDPLWEKLGAPRAIITSLDLSGILRQGVIGTARMAFQNPGALASAIRKSVTALADEGEFKKSMTSIEESPDYGFLKGLGVDFAKSEEQFGGARFVDGVFKKVTGGKMNFVRASERAYTYYLNRLRYELGKHHLDSLRKLGFEGEYDVDAESGRISISGADAGVYKRMASWINIATGRGQLPQGKGQFQTAVRSADKFLNMVFFSPRLMLARVATLYPGTYTKAFTEMAKSKGAFKASRAMMAMHVGDMAAYAALVGGSMAMLQAAFPDSELEGDMTSSDFGQVRMGNTRVDASGGLRTYITAAARVLTGETTTEYGVVKPQPARDTILKFFQGKLGPLPGLALTLAEGQNLVGDPAYGPLKDVLTGNERITPEVLKEILKVTGGTIAQNTVVPMIASDMQRLLSQNDFSPVQIAMLMSFSTLGTGVSTRDAPVGLSPKSQEALRGVKTEPMGRPTTVTTPFEDALGRKVELKLPYMVQQHLQKHADKTFYEILDRIVRQDSFQRMPPAAQRMVIVQLLSDARKSRSPEALSTLGASRFLPMVEKERFPDELTRLMPPPPGVPSKKRWTDIASWGRE